MSHARGPYSARTANGRPVAHAAMAVFACLTIATLLGGCASEFHDGEYHRPNGVARVTRDEMEPLRHPVESSTRYVERAVERLDAPTSNYSALAEQSEEGFEQLGHWWDAVLGRPARRGFADGHD